ncbi:hypothetical protein EVAR_93943_1 [Eumeta japonica]|uniref:Uncharacterized protein n=1 Tax=Eumeta variegata TaxID=151549 RepID=A0A4C1TP60_EUMVA|nr:hypothetical protein EVAR_93943_1 [Eumeta japonica]
MLATYGRMGGQTDEHDETIRNPFLQFRVGTLKSLQPVMGQRRKLKSKALSIRNKIAILFNSNETANTHTTHDLTFKRRQLRRGSPRTSDAQTLSLGHLRHDLT